MVRKLEPRRLTIIRYHTPDGARCKSTDPGALKSTEQTAGYYLRIGGVDVPLGTEDISDAWAVARRLLEERKSGPKADPAAVQAARPILDHMADWLAAVRAGDCGPKRLALLRARVSWIVERAGWRLVGDIRRSSCEVALAALRAEPTARTGVDADGDARGRSAQTSNHYLSHVRQFARWLVQEDRLPRDPLAGSRGVKIDADRRHDRRSPGDEEVRVLFDHLFSRLGKPRSRSGMSGECRALGYAVAMTTGLRANELRSLRESSFDLATGGVRLRAGAAKNRRRTLQPLPRWLCADLQAWFAGGGGTWETFPKDWPGRLLQADLGASREAWILAGGSVEEERRRIASSVCVYEVPTEDGPLFWDFHALRHWYVSQVAATAGISPSTMQSLVRLSDPKLTLQTYAKAQGNKVREAVDSIRIPGTGKE